MVMGWAASTGREPGGLVVGAAGAIGELRIAGVASLNVDRETRATVMALIDGLRTDRVPLMAPRWRRPCSGSTRDWSPRCVTSSGRRPGYSGTPRREVSVPSTNPQRCIRKFTMLAFHR
jgi:hypothetical protein